MHLACDLASLANLVRCDPADPVRQREREYSQSFGEDLSLNITNLDRDSFAKLVRKVAIPDVGKMGIEILSFTIKDIEDKVQYLDSLGKTQTAKVKRDADIGVAEANRDAGIRVSTLRWLVNIRILHF